MRRSRSGRLEAAPWMTPPSPRTCRHRSKSSPYGYGVGWRAIELHGGIVGQPCVAQGHARFSFDLEVLEQGRPGRGAALSQRLQHFVDAFTPRRGAEEAFGGVTGRFQDPISAGQRVLGHLAVGDIGEDSLPRLSAVVAFDQERLVSHPARLAVRTHDPVLRSKGSPVRLVRLDSCRVASRSSGCSMCTHSSGSASRCCGL